MTWLYWTVSFHQLCCRQISKVWTENGKHWWMPQKCCSASHEHVGGTREEMGMPPTGSLQEMDSGPDCNSRDEHGLTGRKASQKQKNLSSEGTEAIVSCVQGLANRLAWLKSREKKAQNRYGAQKRISMETEILGWQVRITVQRRFCLLFQGPYI